MSVLSGSKTQVAAAIARVGETVRILRQAGETRNQYGKLDGGTWEQVGKVQGWRSYSYRADKPEQQYDGAGERDSESPVFVLPYATDVQDGDRIYYNGREYEVTSKPVEYPTHYVARSILVESL